MISRDGNFRAFDSDVIQKFECLGIKMLSWDHGVFTCHSGKSQIMNKYIFLKNNTFTSILVLIKI